MSRLRSVALVAAVGATGVVWSHSALAQSGHCYMWVKRATAGSCLVFEYLTSFVPYGTKVPRTGGVTGIPPAPPGYTGTGYAYYDTTPAQCTANVSNFAVGQARSEGVRAPCWTAYVDGVLKGSK